MSVESKAALVIKQQLFCKFPGESDCFARYEDVPSIGTADREDSIDLKGETTGDRVSLVKLKRHGAFERDGCGFPGRSQEVEDRKAIFNGFEKGWLASMNGSPPRTRRESSNLRKGSRTSFMTIDRERVR